MENILSNRHVMVTGCCGTVGSLLVERLLGGRATGSGERGDFTPKRVVGIDNNETGLFFMEQKYAGHENAEFILGDIRVEKSLARLMAKVDVVFHCAAYKHVGVCERSPFEAIQSNILGVQNVINAALANDVERVIFTSSDKAVNPTNVMGASKLMGERLITAANVKHTGKETVFASARFGNVLGSRGSVLPVFKEQIRRGGPLTLTDEKMTRFIMSSGESVELVLESARLALGGEVFIKKTPAVRISDLAEALIEEVAPLFGHDPAHIEIREIGVRHGEKLYEELMSEEEIRRTVELPEHLVVLPAFRGLYRPREYVYTGAIREGVENPYRSSEQPAMEKEELKRFLRDHKLLEAEPEEHPDRPIWPGEAP